MKRKERDQLITEAVRRGEQISDVAKRFGLKPPAVGNIVRANGVIPIVNFGLEDQEAQERIIRRGKRYSGMEERFRSRSPGLIRALTGAYLEPTVKKAKELPEAPTVSFDDLAHWCRNAGQGDTVDVAALEMSTGKMRSYIVKLRIPHRRFLVTRYRDGHRIVCLHT